jgi:hypothetical protein
MWTPVTLLVVSGEDEVADKVRRGAVILRKWLLTSIVSCRGGGGRLEQARGGEVLRSTDGCIVLQHK